MFLESNCGLLSVTSTAGIMLCESLSDETTLAEVVVIVVVGFWTSTYLQQWSITRDKSGLYQSLT